MTESEKTVSALEAAMEIVRFQTALAENSNQLAATIETYAARHNLKDQEVAYLLCFHAGRLIAEAPREMQDHLVEQHQRIIAETVRAVGGKK